MACFMILRARERQFVFPRPVMVMGIVNVTPDSFSDGGRFFEPSAAIEQAHRLIEDGAEIVDVGGESTRPRAVPVPEEEELRRVLPVLAGLAGRVNVLISIDTYKPAVARAALEAGAGMVNDIGSQRQDAEMWEVVAKYGAAYVAMHMQGTPQTMQAHPSYDDVSREVAEFFQERLSALSQAGLSAEQVVLDPGIGFGKTRQHNLELLAHLGSFQRFGRPVLMGVSRKSFLSQGSTTGPEGRLPAGLAAACWAVHAGVQIIRTHDVKPTLAAVRMAEEILHYSRAEA
jgi:dihydropteroate synthase